MLTRSVMGLAVVVWTAAIVQADPAGQKDAGINITEIMSQIPGGAVVKGGGDESGLPKFEEVTKGMTPTKGLFTLWSYGEDAKDKDPEKLLCEIPASFLGEKFMLSTSFSGGGFFTGFPLEERVVQWELMDRQLLLVEPETQYVVDNGQVVSDAVRRTYPERIRATVPVITKSPAGNPVIDLGALLKSDFADIGWMSMAAGPFGGFMPGGGINASLSKWTKKKSFELNVEVGVALAMPQGSPPGSFEKKLVHFSFWKLPQTDYQPRTADDRVGYFLTANQDWSKPSDARDLFNRYIDRWHLVKRDPSLAMCEPKQPITFYIEKTVPIRFRRAVRDGILEWNKAYEKVGFVNAVEVRQQTDDNEWKNLDPEDMRYSFFRWIVTGAGFAMGPHRANPFTGQIYDADIIFDDSMVRFYEQDAQSQLPSAALSAKFSDPALREFLAKFPQWKRPTQEWEDYSFGGTNDAAMREAMLKRMRNSGHVCCDYADGMKHQLQLGEALLSGQPADVIDKFLYDMVKEVVMHEVGHTLGLRHNFKASSVWTLDEIRTRRAKGEATTGSVMDYNPALFFKDKATDGAFVTPTVGPYDYWAIEYGYRPGDSCPAAAEKAKCDKDGKSKKAEAKADDSDDDEEPAKETVASGDGEIPKEVLDKLPPEVKKMIAAGGGLKITKTGGPKKGPSMPSFAGPNAAEKEMLNKIASRAAEAELVYASDEDTTMLSPDPRSNRFDMGKDPIEWAQTRVDLINSRMKTILDWAVKDQESWYHLRQAFSRLVFEKAFVLDYVGRYVGGQHTSRSHRGDADAPDPFTLVDTQTQRDALTFIEKNLFDDAYFNVSADVLNHLAAPRWWHAGTNINFTVDFPYYNMVGMLQWWNLFDRLFPNTLRRIHDAELKSSSSDKLTVAEYLQRLQKATWSCSVDADKVRDGTWTDEMPYVPTVRRSLQREYLTVVEPLVRTAPGLVVSPDLHAMVQHSVRKLGGDIDEVLKSGKLDFASESHLTACKSRIDRMLAPKLDEYSRRAAYSSDE